MLARSADVSVRNAVGSSAARLAAVRFDQFIGSFGTAIEDDGGGEVEETAAAAATWLSVQDTRTRQRKRDHTATTRYESDG
jgi:hypothetical protein